MSARGSQGGGTHLALRGDLLVAARALVASALLEAGVDELDPDEPEVSQEIRDAASLLDRLGWPGDPGGSVLLEPGDRDLLRRAAMVGLGAAAEAVEEAAGQATHGSGEWGGRDAVTDLRRCAALLDLVGWTPDDDGDPAGRPGGDASDLEAAVLVLSADDGAVRSVSRRFTAMTGFAAADVVGTTPPYPFSGSAEAADVYRAETLALLRAGRFVETTRHLRDSDGRTRPVRVYLTPVAEEAGAPGAVVAVLMDEAARARVVDALLDEDDRLARLFDEVPVNMWTLSADGAEYRRNRAWRRWLGAGERSPGDLESLITVAHPDDLPATRAIVGPALAEGRPFELEVRVRNADGDHRWVLVSGHPRHDADGRFTGHVGTALDIHDRKLRELALHEEAGRLATGGDGAGGGLARLAAASDVPAMIAEEAADLVGADGCTVVRFDAGDGVVVAATGVGPAPGSRVPTSGPGSLARVRMLGRPGRVEHIAAVATGDPHRDLAGRLGVASAVSVPLHAGGRPWGAISAVSGRQAAFGPDEEARLARFSVLASLALAAWLRARDGTAG
jgi:PAS domain S-box-containing protein